MGDGADDLEYDFLHPPSVRKWKGEKRFPDYVYISLGKRLSDAVDDVQKNPYPEVSFLVRTNQKYDVIVKLEPVVMVER